MGGAPFVEVAVTLPVPGTYHYSVPGELAGRALPGARVLVPFQSRGVTGVIVRAAGETPGGVAARPLSEVLDAVPSLDAELIDLCMWVARYYEAPPGEVFRAALPAGTSVESARRVLLTGGGRDALDGRAGGALPARTRRALGRLRGDGDLPVKWKGPRAELDLLVAAGLVELVDARAGARVRPKVVATVRLARRPSPEDLLGLARAPRRAEALALVEAAGELDLAELDRVVRGGAAQARALEKLGLIGRGTREVVRDPWRLEGASAPRDPLAPTPGQAAALAAIGVALDGRRFGAFLLHGVTGSGKTEVYLQAIARVLARGGGALVLVPEIALTPQLAARFRARFGDLVAVLHSGLTPGERYDQWRRLRAGEARIALGARSAVFAPIAGLGIVVVDEEHDGSFKQEEGVRYHARDVALVRAQRAGAPCLLGSATPSLESYANARAGRFTLLELPERPSTRPLPAVEIVDLRTYRPDGESLLTAPLVTALEQTLAAGEQAILFLNRRGFATFVICKQCGHSFRCPHCAVSLTYHRAGERLRCHYCGHAEHVPGECPACRSRAILRLGLGTERIEQALAARFPAARVGRLDRDTAAGPGLGRVLARFAAGEIDVLVGTQMVTKGHDFPGVTLVGVLCADTGMSLPDFRAAERTFQLLTQVAGRAGRGDRPGRVLIQTWQPEHPAVACARTHDYQAFFAAEMFAREEVAWPPHGRLVAVRIDGPSEGDVREVAQALARAAAAGAGPGVTLLGPAEAPLKRLKDRARWQLVVKGTDRTALRNLVHDLGAGLALPSGTRVTIDVDPVSSM